MESQVIAFAASADPSSDKQSTMVAPVPNQRPPAGRAQQLAVILVLLLLLAVTASLLLVSSGAIPHIVYKGSSVSLTELNAIRARGEATICVQQVSALSHFIAMSFEYQCFDTEAEADENVRDVEARLRVLQSP